MIDGIIANRQERAALDGIHPANDQSEAVARIIWSTIAEANDIHAGELIAEYGAVDAVRIGLGLDEPRTEPTPALLESMTRWRAQENPSIVHAMIHRTNQTEARLLIPGDEFWPTSLDALGPHAPFLLWVRGDHELLSTSRCAALVGTRAETGYGQHIAHEFASNLARNDVTVVGTGSYGIDGAAHRGALAAGGKSIAFLAGGSDRYYPKGYSELLRRIKEQGAVVSEVPIGVNPTRWRHLARARVLAAASQAVIVIEAGVGSSALNIADSARALDVPVGAVPGPITSRTSTGCHALIREHGAACITNANDILELLPSSSAE